VAVTQAAVDASGGAPVPPRARGLDLWQFVSETNWVAENFATFWAGYGRVKLKLPGAVYLALAGVVILAVLGFILDAVRSRRPGGDPVTWRPLVGMMAFLHLGLWALSFWSSYSVDVALNGRYVYPTFLPFVVLVILGLTSLAAWRGRVGAVAVASIPVMIAANLAYFVHTVIPDVVALGV
jgi:hypothetical protein